MNKYAGITIVIGALALAAYFVINATQNSECNGNWTDNINPACLLSSATSELNTVLIIVFLLIVLVVGLLAFGPQTQHIARSAGALAVL